MRRQEGRQSSRGLGGYFLVIVRDTVAEWSFPPPFPVIVSVYVPRGPFGDRTRLSVEPVVAGLGPNEPETPDGRPLRLNVTELLKPLIGVIVTA